MPYNHRGGSYAEPEPKPFGKVLVKRDKADIKPVGHDRFHVKTYTGRLTCVLTSLRQLHVGSGIYELDANENPVRGQVSVDGKAVIPGTSLKGAIRSIAEAITNSCVRITRSDIGRNLSCRGAEACRMVTPRQPSKLCVCCSVFGALGYQGRVSFSDARLLSGVMATHPIQAPYTPRDSARGYKDAHGLFNGRKFYYHGEPVAAREGEPYQVVAENSDFEFTISFESLSDAEMCLLVVAMGILDDIVIKLGGGKQAMLGSAEIVPRSLALRVPEASFTDISSGEMEIKEDVNQYLLDHVGKSSRLINEDSLDELMKIWVWPSDRKAPTGMY
jgi:CRISPR-associated protein Csm3